MRSTRRHRAVRGHAGRCAATRTRTPALRGVYAAAYLPDGEYAGGIAGARSPLTDAGPGLRRQSRWSASLRAYGLTPYTWPTALVVGELVGVAGMMTPGLDLYVSARHRDNALRLVVRDQHPRHADPDTVTLCAERRRSALWLLDSVVDDWGGEWDVCDALPPHAGIRSWARLPR
ncbi:MULTISPECIES: ATP-binding protein [unclassified Streptomyces]|uniref:ATP-binding protein n=1 Tax=unclassified Streptomyces TaxID=2593676 RepID=UPI0033A40B6A